MIASIRVALAILLTSIVIQSPAGATQSRPAGRHGQSVAPIRVIPAKQRVATIGKTVVVNYPRFAGTDVGICQKLNGAMQRHIKSSNFYGDLVQWTLEETFVAPAAVSASIDMSRMGGAHWINSYYPFNYQLRPKFKAMTMEDLFGQKVDYKKLSPIVQRYLIADVRGMRLNMDPDEYFGGDWLQPSCYEGFSFDREGVTFALDLGAESLNGYHTKVLYEDIASLFAPTSLVYKYVHEPARELQEMRAPRHLLLPGDHHGEEVSSKSGERWLAFNRDRAGGILCERVLKVEKIPDPVGSTRTGKRVSTTAGAKPLFLIRGIAGLKPARIQCANLTESKQLGPNETLAFKFGGTQYTLSIKTWKSNTKDPGEDTSESNYFDMQEISLSDGKQTQIVNSLPNIHLPADTTFGPTLLWAGDLDRDGKLDLLMDTSHYDNRSEWTLFLSSGVPAGDFVRKVARFITYGC